MDINKCLACNGQGCIPIKDTCHEICYTCRGTGIDPRKQGNKKICITCRCTGLVKVIDRESGSYRKVTFYKSCFVCEGTGFI